MLFVLALIGIFIGLGLWLYFGWGIRNEQPRAGWLIGAAIGALIVLCTARGHLELGVLQPLSEPAIIAVTTLLGLLPGSFWSTASIPTQNIVATLTHLLFYVPYYGIIVGSISRPTSKRIITALTVVAIGYIYTIAAMIF